MSYTHIHIYTYSTHLQCVRADTCVHVKAEMCALYMDERIDTHIYIHVQRTPKMSSRWCTCAYNFSRQNFVRCTCILEERSASALWSRVIRVRVSIDPCLCLCAWLQHRIFIQAEVCALYVCVHTYDSIHKYALQHTYLWEYTKTHWMLVYTGKYWYEKHIYMYSTHQHCRICLHHHSVCIYVYAKVYTLIGISGAYTHIYVQRIPFI